MIDVTTFRELPATELDGTPTTIGAMLDRAGPVGDGGPVADCLLLGSTVSCMYVSDLTNEYPYSDAYTLRVCVQSYLDPGKVPSQRQVIVRGPDLNLLLRELDLVK